MNKQDITNLINSTIIDNDNGLITAEKLRAVLNAINEGAGDGYIFISTATPSTTPIAITEDSKVFYIATEEGDYANFGLGNINELSVIKSDKGSWIAEGLGYSFELRETVNIGEDSVLCITDKEGNIVVKIDENGISATAVKALNENGELEPVKQDSLSELYEDSLFITDKDGNVIIKIDENGIASPNITINGWAGKVLATYGDSVTAVNNGNYKYPYNGTTTEWANYTARHLNISKQYGRGIGGQKYAWGNSGGSLCWVDPLGSLIGRIDNQSFDSWDGTYPSGITAEMEANGEAVRTRGCMSSWHRITHQFPESMKDSIDVVLVMAHNDDYDTTNWLFVENDTTDTEWAASGAEYYGVINGDYNISTLEGGILSTLMKLQIWMPNAIIVLMTGVSGEGTTGELLPEEINKTRFQGIAETVRNMGKLASIPVIDTFATDGINGWNRTKYISDSIHPYTIAGGKMLARAVIGGLKSIIPNL